MRGVWAVVARGEEGSKYAGPWLSQGTARRRSAFLSTFSLAAPATPAPTAEVTNPALATMLRASAAVRMRRAPEQVERSMVPPTGKVVRRSVRKFSPFVNAPVDESVGRCLRSLTVPRGGKDA